MNIPTLVGIGLCAGSLATLAWLRRSAITAALLAAGLIGITLQVIGQRHAPQEQTVETSAIRERCQLMASRVRSHAQIVREYQSDKSSGVADHVRDKWLDLLAGSQALWGVCVDINCPQQVGPVPDPVAMDKLAETLQTGECRFR